MGILGRDGRLRPRAEWPHARLRPTSGRPRQAGHTRRHDDAVQPVGPEVTPKAMVRRLGVRDAVVIGLGSMSAQASSPRSRPRPRRPGRGCWLAAAAVVAYCNATSSARLAPLPGLGRHLCVRPGTARRILGIAGRLGVRRRQDRRAAPRWRSPSGSYAWPTAHGWSPSRRWSR